MIENYRLQIANCRLALLSEAPRLNPAEPEEGEKDLIALSQNLSEGPRGSVPAEKDSVGEILLERERNFEYVR